MTNDAGKDHTVGTIYPPRYRFFSGGANTVPNDPALGATLRQVIDVVSPGLAASYFNAVATWSAVVLVATLAFPSHFHNALASALVASFVILLGLAGSLRAKRGLKQARAAIHVFAAILFALVVVVLVGGITPAMPTMMVLSFLPVLFIVSGTTPTGIFVGAYLFLSVAHFAISQAGFQGFGWFAARPAGLMVVGFFSLVTLLQAMNGAIRIASGILRLQRKEQTLRLATETERDTAVTKLRAFARISNGWLWETDAGHGLTRLIKADQLIDPQRSPSKNNTPNAGPAFLERLEGIPEFQQRLQQDFVPLLAKRQPFHGVQIQSRSAEGINLWFRVSGEPIFTHDGQFLGYLGSAINITRERHREEAMGRALIQASEAHKSKAAFLANASHELRTPLNGIYGMTQLLRADCSDPVHQGYLDAVAESAKRLENTVDLILTAATGVPEHQPDEQTPFNVREMVSTVMAIAGDTLRRPELRVKREIDGSVPEVLVGNSRLLSTALVHLLNNAMKFTPAGEVVVRMRAERSPMPGHMMVYLAVSDTGIGIAEADLDKIFLPLVQLDQSYQRAYEGLGLGLTAVRQAVERLKGSLGVESEVGKGSTFFITLDLATTEAEAGFEADADADTAPWPESGLPSQPKPKPSPPGSHGHGQPPVTQNTKPTEKWNILIAEDNPINATYLSAILERAGHRTCTAANGVEALGYVRIERFDAILMDMQMPIMDGVQAARAIRSYEASSGNGRRTPIIAVTANDSDEARLTCLDAGMEDYVPKPVEPQDLFNALRRLIGVRPSPGVRGPR